MERTAAPERSDPTRAAILADLNDLAARLNEFYERVLLPALERFVSSLRDLWSVIEQALRPWVASARAFLEATDFCTWISAEDEALALRAFARKHNAWHPRRKVAWRRLSRPQRQAAALDWIVQHALTAHPG